MHQVHGNVYEWCLDSWDGSLNYPIGPVVDPFVTGGINVIFRGGSWNSYSSDSRSVARFRNYPNYQASIVGFRIVLAPVIPRTSMAVHRAAHHTHADVVRLVVPPRPPRATP
ncbi:MAG: SUMF1/EgtB/PvdO family nonheme iron enzyme [Planctomycetes bacterium]|nr:SUMF1/EgtB/PvdO family nonheme iron enzyme [Planctomycetota bacterium]